jgi:hypothetical protein
MRRIVLLLPVLVLTGCRAPSPAAPHAVQLRHTLPDNTPFLLTSELHGPLDTLVFVVPHEDRLPSRAPEVFVLYWWAGGAWDGREAVTAGYWTHTIDEVTGDGNADLTLAVDAAVCERAHLWNWDHGTQPPRGYIDLEVEFDDGNEVVQEEFLVTCPDQ